MIGETLRAIRKNRNLTQQQLAEGIMKQATYSRIESGQLQVSATLLYALVERLNVSMNEFFYIAQQYSATPKQQLWQTFSRIELTVPAEIEEQLAATSRYLQRQHDEDVLMLHYVYESMEALVHAKSIDVVREFAEKVWARMQQLDHWYINDLELINAIILYFPLDVAKEVTQTAIRRLAAYDHFERNMTQLTLYFCLNLSTLHIMEGTFAECLAELEQVHTQYQLHLTSQTLSFIIARKMICKHYLNENFDDERRAFAMVEQLFPNADVFCQLKKELDINGVAYK